MAFRTKPLHRKVCSHIWVAFVRAHLHLGLAGDGSWIVQLLIGILEYIKYLH